MAAWFQELDELLRARRTVPELVSESGRLLPLRVFFPLAVGLGALYGFFMGWYGLIGPEEPRVMQLVASTVKVPALFLLTLLVTYPSLYVFNALVGCRLSFLATLRLLVAAVVVNLAVAASFGPILAFFTLSTTSYSFVVLLNVGLLGIAGVVGLGFLLQTLKRLARAQGWVRPTGTEPSWRRAPEEHRAALERAPGADELGPRSPTLVFNIWVVIYGLVGAQMGWLLRPFIGQPGAPFTWFRPRSGNFFESVLTHLERLLGV
ncbi:MAG TPA: hypothetical protein VD963_11050 [Phycisphaerales bacterium]|nr:hypothetical protein [Phycisphaerales bacterium]